MLMYSTIDIHWKIRLITIGTNAHGVTVSVSTGGSCGVGGTIRGLLKVTQILLENVAHAGPPRICRVAAHAAVSYKTETRALARSFSEKEGEWCPVADPLTSARRAHNIRRARKTTRQRLQDGEQRDEVGYYISGWHMFSDRC